MTTNQDRAAEVIASAGAICGSDCTRTPADPITDCPRCVWCIGAYAQALADAGLLTPDPGRARAHIGADKLRGWGGVVRDDQYPHNPCRLCWGFMPKDHFKPVCESCTAINRRKGCPMTTSQDRAARTNAKAGEVLARLDREYDTVADSNPRPGRDEYTAGYLAGIDTAHKWLTQALDGTHE